MIIIYIGNDVLIVIYVDFCLSSKGSDALVATGLWSSATRRRFAGGRIPLAAPVLLLLMAAIVEFGTIMFVTVLTEGGLREAARWGITGQTPEDGDRAAHILEVVADRTLGLVDVSKATVKITAYPTFDDIGRGEAFVDGNGNGKYDNGGTFKDCNGNGNGKWDNDRRKSDAGGPATQRHLPNGLGTAPAA